MNSYRNLKNLKLGKNGGCCCLFLNQQTRLSLPQFIHEYSNPFYWGLGTWLGRSGYHAQGREVPRLDAFRVSAAVFSVHESNGHSDLLSHVLFFSEKTSSLIIHNILFNLCIYNTQNILCLYCRLQYMFDLFGGIFLRDFCFVSTTFSWP